MISQKSKDQNIDKLIQGIKLIIKNRCSLLDEDVNLLKEVVVQLEKLKRKRKGNDVELIVKIVELLTKFFLMSSEISNVIDHIK